MGSCSLWTSACMRASRTMKFVAEVSSSRSSPVAPVSTASTMLAAWLVLPLASSLEKAVVLRPWGRSPMKAPMSTCSTRRPSSARILTRLRSLTTHSRPSPGTCG